MYFNVNKTDFKKKKITRDKDGYFIMLKGSIYAEDLTVIKVYTPNNIASKTLKKN